MKEEKIKCESATAERLQDQESLNSKKWWWLAKSFFNEDDYHYSYLTLKVNNDIISEDHEKAQVFNDFFLDSSQINYCQAPLSDAPCHADNTLLSIEIRNKYIENLLTSLDITNTIGPDQISQIML